MRLPLIFASALFLSASLSACSESAPPPFPSGSFSNGNSTSGSALGSVDTAKLNAFEAEFKTVATTPQGAVKCLFRALATLEDDLELGKAMLTVVLDSRKLTEDSSSPTGFKLGVGDLFLVDQIMNKPHVVHSYIGGTVNANYTDHDKVNLPLNFPADGSVVAEVKVDNSANKADVTEGRIYVQSSGKDIPTPINMAKNSSGLWKVTSSSLSSIATGVKVASNNDF